MGSNSSKNINQSNDNITNPNNNELIITPLSKLKETQEDPRSPTIHHRTPLSSPNPVRSWRTIAEQFNNDIDPRSPSLQRTPAHKLVIAKTAEPFDPRSPSINRTPIADLSASEEVAFPQELSSPYVAGRAIQMSTEEPVVEEEKEEEVERKLFADSAELAEERKHKDGASISLDASNQLYNSDALQKDFQQTGMNSVEIVKEFGEAAPVEVKKDNLRKRKKNHKRDSFASSPLKKSYSPVMGSDRENCTPTYSQKQLHNNTPPRSPLSTLSTSNRVGSPIDKSKLNMNLFADSIPPSIVLG